MSSAPHPTIRLADAADVAAVADLYARISETSFATRFMSRRGPNTPLSRLAEFDTARGDVVLLAESADGPAALLGEARYVPRPGGVADFALLVDDHAQGQGLGRLLLAELLQVAEARGISRLSAAVLADNVRMLRLVRRLGCAFVRPCDYGTFELEISSRGGMPGWPDDGQRHVLVESRSLQDGPAVERLRAEGATIRRCPGPAPAPEGTVAEPGRRCPLVAAGTCLLAEGADEILDLLPAGAGGYGAIRAEHERRWPERLHPAETP